MPGYFSNCFATVLLFISVKKFTEVSNHDWGCQVYENSWTLNCLWIKLLHWYWCKLKLIKFEKVHDFIKHENFLCSSMWGGLHYIPNLILTVRWVVIFLDYFLLFFGVVLSIISGLSYLVVFYRQKFCYACESYLHYTSFESSFRGLQNDIQFYMIFVKDTIISENQNQSFFFGLHFQTL